MVRIWNVSPKLLSWNLGPQAVFKGQGLLGDGSGGLYLHQWINPLVESKLKVLLRGDRDVYAVKEVNHWKWILEGIPHLSFLPSLPISSPYSLLLSPSLPLFFSPSLSISSLTLSLVTPPFFGYWEAGRLALPLTPWHDAILYHRPRQ